MNKKYFFFDIDGTLAYGKLGHKIISESTRYTVHKLEKNGHFVAIATGRSQPMAYEFLKQLGLHNMVSDGGNGLTINDEFLDVEPLDKGNCIKLINECIEKKIPFALSSTVDKVRYTNSDAFVKAIGEDYMDTRIMEDFDPSAFESIYKIYIAGNEDELDNLKLLTHCRYNKTHFFVEPTEKHKGIIRMMEYLKAPLKDVVVFGDDLNDLSMFQKTWTSIAMGNAVEELKKKADYVTDDVDKDGIYKACLKFGWISE